MTISEAPSPASRDFRSDTITTPTKFMLEAMSQATLGDDVYHEDETTTAFELQVAASLAHEAGLFVSSGTMGNQLALRAHLTQPPHSILCDYRAHIATAEAGGVAILSQAMLQTVIPRNGVYLTLEDVKRDAILIDDIYSAPTRVISLENTLGGSIIPLTEVQRISAFARSHGIKMHLDGARLWNAVAAGAGTLEQYGREFDSISVCFSKGLGAPIGSMLVASNPLIKHARWIRKAIGGGMRQTGPIVNAAKIALERVYPKLAGTHARARYLAEEFKKQGLRTVLPVDTSIIFLDLEDAALESNWIIEEGAKNGLKLGGGGRFVVHHQITEEAVEDLVKTIRTVCEKRANGDYAGRAIGGEAGYGSLKKA